MGSVRTVLSRDIRLQSVGVVVKHHALTDACHTNNQHQNKINSKSKSRKTSFNLYKVLLVTYKVVFLESLSLVKVPIVSHHLARGKLTKRKFMKIKREKIEELQEGA